MEISEEPESSGSRAVVALPSYETPRHYQMRLDVYAAVLRRLQESNHEEAALPDFADQLLLHFNRLPARYALDVKVERAEDVLTHRRLLKLAEDPATRPVFEVRSAQVSPRHSTDSMPPLEEDDQSSPQPSGQGVLVPPTLGSSSKFEAITQESEIVEEVDTAVNATLSTRPVHEITFSTINKPKLLSQLTSLLGELGLNIKEAHAFSTVDGFSLDVFVVDGWSQKESDGLKDALSKEILKLKDQPDLKQKSIAIFEHELIPARIEIPKDGTDEWGIDVTKLKFETKVASGSFADLHRGTYFSQDVAIKLFKPECVQTENLKEFSQEVDIMRKIRHRNVVQFLGACFNPPTLCIVTEFMARGSIYDFLHKQKFAFKLQTLLKVALDVAKGVSYLHVHNIIHRDLKTANILMDEHGLVKVADFGVARVQTESGIMTAETGTYKWMAPEVFEHKPYNHKADVYSFGIVLWELLTGHIPYEYLTPVQAAYRVCQKGLRPKIPKKAHPKLKGLLERCWHQDPAQRPGFEEIIEMLQQIITEVGDEDPRDKQCMSFLVARFRKPRY